MVRAYDLLAFHIDPAPTGRAEAEAAVVQALAEGQQADSRDLAVA